MSRVCFKLAHWHPTGLNQPVIRFHFISYDSNGTGNHPAGSDPLEIGPVQRAGAAALQDGQPTVGAAEGASIRPSDRARCRGTTLDPELKTMKANHLAQTQYSGSYALRSCSDILQGKAIPFSYADTSQFDNQFLRSKVGFMSNALKLSPLRVLNFTIKLGAILDTMKPIQFAIIAIIAAVAGVKATSTNSTTEICLAICYAEEPECGETSIPVETSSDCWTCCSLPTAPE
ncbi:hypothetical protein DEU56DRAFT_755659 [Suillus clintonianus]|uniref:uncharacterized protein n=1 Tax=Suillus clintonianus TaxID=1904413 RepID=UPI001B87DFD5|nr:uncharacterized protein DEU56DRAFT_755659 [Suillus clintonianus]KAG2138935.1 hypothetical protein DEU56DRAFT_755659 [Suillus clintonianus]